MLECLLTEVEVLGFSDDGWLLERGFNGSHLMVEAVCTRAWYNQMPLNMQQVGDYGQ